MIWRLSHVERGAGSVMNANVSSSLDAGWGGWSRMSFLEIVWTDEVTGRQGFLVIDALVRGAASGGLRMREGCTLAEVRELARGMTLKEAIVYAPADRYVPFGGGKGGIDCSPYDPGARSLMARYIRAMKPILQRFWSAGEDFGVRQDVLDEVAGEAGLGSTIDAALRLVPDPRAGLDRIRAGFAVQVAGVGLGDLVGGFGVAHAAVVAAGWLGLRGPGGGRVGQPGGPRAMIQGFGSMGGATARYLAAAGIPVVGVCDAHGVIANPAGLDVERLLLTRDGFGAVDRSQLRADDVERPVDWWLRIQAEILVPAAMSYVITEANGDQVQAGLVVEAANAPITPAAQARLSARGVTVIPDIVANVGTNAWWWWTLFGDIAPRAEDAFAKVAGTLGPLVTTTLVDAANRSITPRQSAQSLSARHTAQLALRYP
jgi:glutamate dehydrogenase (NAD(P)+)